MKKLLAVPCALVGVLIALSLFTSPASAQATRTWVSGVGDDANPCSRTAPCKTFAGAISKTAAGGEINCLDPGGFGALTITKSITISCEVGTAGVLVSGTNGINVAAAATDVVVLNGLDFQGLGSGLIGVSIGQASAVHIQHCRISGFRAGGAAGILFAPAAGTTEELFVSDTLITDNGTGSAGGGIIVQPNGSGVANAILTRLMVENNTLGIQSNGTGNTGGISVFVTNTTVSGNTNAGIHALSPSGGANSFIFALRTTSVLNGTGFLADGAGVALLDSVAARNATGVSAVNGGNIYTYKNNAINFNLTTDGTPNNQLNLQ
jgi:hypothetical protein